MAKLYKFLNFRRKRRKIFVYLQFFIRIAKDSEMIFFILTRNAQDAKYGNLSVVYTISQNFIRNFNFTVVLLKFNQFYYGWRLEIKVKDYLKRFLSLSSRNNKLNI